MLNNSDFKLEMLFNLVVITKPEFFASEAECIRAVLDEGVQLVHIRKPGASVDDVSKLIRAIGEEYYQRLCIHYHHELAVNMTLGGVHLSSVRPSAPQGWQGRVSMSCHSLSEVSEGLKKADYCFLSPIFDSISKQGYKSAFGAGEINTAHQNEIIGSRVFALGGINADNIGAIEEMGFGGAALLGYVWGNNCSAGSVIRRIRELRAGINVIRQA